MPFQYYFLCATAILNFPSELDASGDVHVTCEFTIVMHISYEIATDINYGLARIIFIVVKNIKVFHDPFDCNGDSQRVIS